MQMNFSALSRAATEARGLAMDAVQASQSGHLGLPLGCAEIGAVLYGYLLRHNPDQPRWINRDYFILSAGHGSMFLYAWLHLSGYDVSIGDIQNFLKRRESSVRLARWGKALATRLVWQWRQKWRPRISTPATIAFSIS